MQGALSGGGKIIQRQYLRQQCKATTSWFQPKLHQGQVSRQFAWVPEAYRRTRSRTPPRNRPGKHPRNNNKNSNARLRSRSGTRGKRGSSRGRVSTNGSVKPSEPYYKSLKFRIGTQEDKFFDLREKLERRLKKYRQLLGENISESTTTKPNRKDNRGFSSVASQQQMIALLSRISDLHVNSTAESWEDVEKTETAFRGLCQIVSDMITASTKLQISILRELNEERTEEQAKDDESYMTYYNIMGEQLLLCLINMQNDRCQYVESLPDDTSSEDDPDHSIFDWLKSKVFGNPSPAKQPNMGEETKYMLAHNDPLCGPRLEHLQNVSSAMFRTLRDELMKEDKGSSFRKIKRAQRVQQLVDKMPSYVEPDAFCIKNLMNAFACIGSFESAKACERIYEKYPDMQNTTCETLLHAYYLASKFSPRKQERSKAAIRAEEIVREKWNAALDEEGTDQYEEDKFVHCAKVLLCLHATGSEAIPNLCKRADSIVDLCIGRDNFEEIFRKGNLEGLWKTAPASLTLPLLNCLVLIYASSGDASRVPLAKRLLKILLEDPDFKGDKDIPYPDLRTCKAVMHGLVGIDQKKDKWSSGREMKRENIDFGMELVDMMFARSPCWPDQSFFHLLFRVVRIGNPDNAGMIADEILSKMHTRQCFDQSGFPFVTRSIYHEVLRCWIASAKSGDAVAAKRAFEHLEMMESQSLPLTASADVRSWGGTFVYNSATTPVRTTYRLVMRVCSAFNASDRETALDIALAVSDKMKQREILPTSETYALLFSCVGNLLPENSTRRQEVTEQLLADARKQGNVNDTVLSQLKNANGEQTPGNLEDGGKNFPIKGGLLADL